MTLLYNSICLGQYLPIATQPNKTKAMNHGYKEARENVQHAHAVHGCFMMLSKQLPEKAPATVFLLLFEIDFEFTLFYKDSTFPS